MRTGDFMKVLNKRKNIFILFSLLLIIVFSCLTYLFFHDILLILKPLPENSNRDSKNGEEKVRLVFMNWDSSEKATRQNLEMAINEYGLEHPDIEIVNMSIPLYEYQEQLIKQTSIGNDPDIIQFDGNWPALLGDKNVLEPLDDYFAKDKNDLDFFYGEVLKSCKYKGTLYSIPYCMNFYGLWYNKNLLKMIDIQEPPKSMEELAIHLEKIKSELPNIKKPKPVDVYGIGLDITRTEYAFSVNWPIFDSFGVQEPLSQYWGTEANGKRMINALKWFKTAHDEKFSPEGVKTNMLREMMANEQIVYKVDSPGLRGTIQKINPGFAGNLFDRTFGVVPVPPAKGIISSTVVNTYSLGISARCKHKEKAWEFIKFISKDKKSVQNYTIPSGYIPSLTSVLNNNAVELNNSSTHVFLNDLLPESKMMTFGPGFSESGLAIMDGMQKVYSGTEPTVVLKEVNEMISQIIK